MPRVAIPGSGSSKGTRELLNYTWARHGSDLLEGERVGFGRPIVKVAIYS